MEKYKVNKNYCTCWPEGLFGVRYNYACYLHDVDYKEKTLTRFKADNRFRKNILEEYKGHNKIIIGFFVSIIMFLGVRIFGRKSW